MSSFAFTTDEESEGYCLNIAREMLQFFDISEEEAIGRINRCWLGLTILGLDARLEPDGVGGWRGEDDWLYHELPAYWAKSIYYGPGVYFWVSEDGLTPVPYP